MPRDCDVCHKTEGEEESKKLFRCTRCLKRFYCGPECQKSDWSSHKTECKATPHWYDKYRRCGQKDFGQKEKHEGELELITWACPEEGTGWGACVTEECDDLRRKFEVELGGDFDKFYKYWPQGFRWRCCGAPGDSLHGCDHHGRGKKPCSCDFCKMGKALPAKIYMEKTASRMGLDLARGPDPRSYDPNQAMIAGMGRSMFGMDS